MDSTSLETLSRWASVAAVALSALAAIAITIAAYASARLLNVTNARTAQLHAESARALASVETKAAEAEQQARAALAAANELKAADRPPDAEVTSTSGSKPVSTNAPVATPMIAESTSRSEGRRFERSSRQQMITILQAAVSPPQVELSWVADAATYARARELTRVLQQAGWTVTPAGSLLIASTPAATTITTGLLSDEALLLRKAFDTAGAKSSIVLEPTLPPDRIRVMIGNDE